MVPLLRRARTRVPGDSDNDHRTQGNTYIILVEGTFVGHSAGQPPVIIPRSRCGSVPR